MSEGDFDVSITGLHAAGRRGVGVSAVLQPEDGPQPVLDRSCTQYLDLRQFLFLGEQERPAD
jgi:hypothetical protein